MANGIGGLLGRIGSGIQGLLGNPLVQGVGMAAAAGANPLLGLLAAPAIQSSRDRKAAELELLRQGVRRRQRQEAAQEELTGLLGRREFIQSPVGLLNLEGGVDVLPAQRSVPAVQTPEGQQQLMSILTQLSPDAVASGMLGQVFPDPSSFERKLTTVEGRLGRDLTDDEVLKLAGGGTTINVGGESKLDEPIPISSVSNVRLPGGQAVPIGTTFRQAREMGAQVLSSEEQKRSTQADQALGILEELERLALGSGGIFPQVSPGLANRAAAAIQFGLDALTQKDPRASQFHDLTQSTVAPFVRFLGDSGALAEGDVQRALGLLPRIFPLPDTGEVAAAKLRTLREIIELGVRNLNRQESQGSLPSQNVIDLGGGFSVEFID